jgi:hypothetical protein
MSAVLDRPEKPTRFQYVWIPADNNYAIEAREFNQVALEDDEFINMVKHHFGSTNPESGVDREMLIKQMSEHAKNDIASSLDSETLDRLLTTTSVDIMSIAVPSRENGFIGVSLYCDDKGKSKNLALNQRACGLGSACGLIGQTFHGDVFLSRMYDDGEDHWYRLDFTLSDVSSDAPWVKRAAEQAARKVSGAPASLSGLADRFLAQTGGGPAIISPDAPQVKSNAEGESETFKWYQTNEEIDVTFSLDPSVTKSMISVDIKAKTLVVKVGQQTLADGHLFDAVDPSESTWTYSSKDQLLQVCLSKRNSRMWDSLF